MWHFVARQNAAPVVLGRMTCLLIQGKCAAVFATEPDALLYPHPSRASLKMRGVYIVPMLRVGTLAVPLCGTGRGASPDAFPRRPWEREKDKRDAVFATEPDAPPGFKSIQHISAG